MTLLQEITLTADRPVRPNDAAVENMSRVVCSLLARGLRRSVLTPNFWKVSVRINTRDQAEDGLVLLGVLIVNRSFPSDEFVAWPLEVRQSYMLKFLEDVLRDVFRDFAIDERNIERGIQEVMTNRFRNVFCGKKKFKKSTTGDVARIECEQEMDEARVYVVLKRRGSENRLLMARTVPDEFVFQKYFGSIEWSESSQPVLRMVDGALAPTQ